MDTTRLLQTSEKKLTIPEKLYGRDEAISSLYHVFQSCCRGKGKVVLVPGHSGIGKTALVQQLREPVEQRNGFFLQGKFDQYSQGIPYYALRQALTEFADVLLKEGPERQEKWRADIQNSVGQLGALLINLAPRFEQFIGCQPPLQDISPQEAAHRFSKVIHDFLALIATPEHPLVLFIDDWQWADSGSLKLLSQLALDHRKDYLLLVAAFRDDEVAETHPFALALNEIQRLSSDLHLVEMNPLNKDEILALVTDTVPGLNDAGRLAAFLQKRAAGNPLFLRQLVVFMYQAGLLYRCSNHTWAVAADTVLEKELPRTIVDLYKCRLKSWPPELQKMISHAACLGNSFDLETLSIVTSTSVEECRTLVQEAITSHMVESARTPGSRFKDIHQEYVFLHDRIQQAAHSLIDSPKLPSIRLQMGRLLLNRLSPEQLEHQIFRVAEHFNAGRQDITSRDEISRAVELNLRAARKARTATDYQAMLKFHRAAGTFLESTQITDWLWTHHHNLGLELFKERSESEFLEGDKTEAENCLRIAEERAETALEKAQTLNQVIVHNTLLGRYPEAIDAARRALALFNISLPEKDFEVARDMEIAAIRAQLEQRSVESLRELPIMSDADMCMATKLLITMGPPCYRSHQKLWSVLVPKAVNLTMSYGHIPQIGYSHTAFAGLLGWVDNDYPTARAWGELAEELMVQCFPSSTDQSVFYLMIGSSYRHWFNHLNVASKDYAEAYEIGVRSGNLQYAAYAFGHNMYCRYYQGVPLSILKQETIRALDFSRARLNQWAIDLFQGGLHLFELLTGEVQNDLELFETRYLTELRERQNIQVLCIYHILKTQVLLLLGRHEEALDWSNEVSPILYTVGTQGLLPWPEHCFARFLIISELYPTRGKKTQLEWTAELEKILGQLDIWAKHGPENYRHKLLLAKAETAKLQGQPAAAIELYEQAIMAAGQGGFLHWQALAAERAAALCESLENSGVAQVYWQQAYRSYSQWGAVAKLSAMDKLYRTRLTTELQNMGCEINAHSSGDAPIHRGFIDHAVQNYRKLAKEPDFRSLEKDFAEKSQKLAEAMENLQYEVADRKQAEEHLRASQMRLQLALDSAEMGAWHYDLIEDRRYFDATTCDLLGLDHASFTGKGEEFFSAVYPDDQPLIKQGIKNAIEHGQPYQVEYRASLSDGSIRYLSNFGKIVHDENGQAIRLDGIVMDVTNRKTEELRRKALTEQLQQSNAELAQRENELRTLAEAMPQVVWIGQSDGRISYFNQQWMDYSGLSLKESCGNRWQTLIHPDDRSAVKEAWQAAQNSTGAYSLECRLQRADGTYRWWLLRAEPFCGAGGKIEKWFGTFTDIDELKTAQEQKLAHEKQLQQTQKLESLGVLAGGIAHDFNNILMTILGNADLALRRLPAESPAMDSLRKIENASEKAAGLANQMLAYSGKGRFVIEPLDLNRLIEEMIHLLEVSISKSIVLRFDFNPQVPTVEADATQMRQIVMNLVINASEAIADRSGVIAISTGAIECDRRYLETTALQDEIPEGMYAYIEIADTGCGMDKETVSKLFDPYFTTKLTGRGLGMAATLGIVRGHNGAIKVYSELDKGTTFKVLLPASRKSATYFDDLEADEAWQGNGTVLLVDDEETILAVGTEMLQELGFEVITAADGREALNLYQQHRDKIQCVVMDLTMPNMNGEQAFRELRRIDPQISIIMTSGYNEQEVSQKFLGKGLAGFLQKPFRYSSLKEALQKLTANRVT